MAGARGVVVVIDVVRAFTTAAFAFAAGAQRVILAGTVEQALALRERYPGSLVMGEVGGLPVPGFDLWNSPAQFQGLDLTGRTLIQRTTAGTQGVVLATQAERLLTASFVVAGATARVLAALRPAEVAFIVTGVREENPGSGSEDVACAEYLSALLNGEQPDPADYLKWLATRGTRIEGAIEEQINQFMDDLKLCAAVDRFDFVMEVRRIGQDFIMERRDVPAT